MTPAKKKEFSLFDWMDENPIAANMGMGLLKSLQEEQQADAYQPAEIKKTQYGYLLGQGMGDPSKYKRNTFSDRAMQAYITGAEQKRKDRLNKEILNLLKAPTRVEYKKVGSFESPSSEYGYDGGMTPDTKMPIENILEGRGNTLSSAVQSLKRDATIEKMLELEAKRKREEEEKRRINAGLTSSQLYNEDIR